MRILAWMCLLAVVGGESVWSQENDTITVRENYFGTSLLRVLHDFENKYRMPLKYDTALVATYKYDYLYTDTPRKVAFDIIFRDHPTLSYYVDEEGVYCIVLTKNLPKNRTKLENTRYAGRATKQNLTVTGRIKDQTNGEALPFASVFVEGRSIGTSTNTDGY
ncbi:MAG: carboxypeptidase-like regulatory domain-containing protein, partial [Tannerellaceae bacterium]|nr:carboxypeptidase-like regulatory domain-containing protein [Tannerellaceae bacterium]